MGKAVAMFSIPWRRYRSLLFLVLMCIMTCWHRDGNATDFNGGTTSNDRSGRGEKPQIPTENFEWNGTFRVPGQIIPVVTDLTIRGMWQNGHFNLYMEQGFKGVSIGLKTLFSRNTC